MQGAWGGRSRDWSDAAASQRGPGMDSQPSLDARKERGSVVLRRNQRCQHLDLNCQLPEHQRCIPVVLTAPPPLCLTAALGTKAQAYILRKRHLPIRITPHMLNSCHRPSKEDPERGRLQSSVHRFKFRNIKLKDQTILCLVLNHVIQDNVPTTNGMIFITKGMVFITLLYLRFNLINRELLIRFPLKCQ